MVTRLPSRLRYSMLTETWALGVTGCLLIAGLVLPGPSVARTFVDIGSEPRNAYQWPKQVYCTYVPTESRIIHEYYKYGVPIGIEIRIPRDIAIGNLFPIPVFGAYFFRSREGLMYFERNGRVRSFMAFLPPFHAVRADQKIDHNSMGAEVTDEKIGSGYALFVPSNDAEEVINECLPRSLRIHNIYSIRYSYRLRRSVMKKQRDEGKAIDMRILEDF